MDPSEPTLSWNLPLCNGKWKVSCIALPSSEWPSATSHLEKLIAKDRKGLHIPVEQKRHGEPSGFLQHHVHSLQQDLPASSNPRAPKKSFGCKSRWRSSGSPPEQLWPISDLKSNPFVPLHASSSPSSHPKSWLPELGSIQSPNQGSAPPFSNLHTPSQHPARSYRTIPGWRNKTVK